MIDKVQLRCYSSSGFSICSKSRSHLYDVFRGPTIIGQNIVGLRVNLKMLPESPCAHRTDQAACFSTSASSTNRRVELWILRFGVEGLGRASLLLHSGRLRYFEGQVWDVRVSNCVKGSEQRFAIRSGPRQESTSKGFLRCRAVRV